MAIILPLCKSRVHVFLNAEYGYCLIQGIDIGSCLMGPSAVHPMAGFDDL